MGLDPDEPQQLNQRELQRCHTATGEEGLTQRGCQQLSASHQDHLQTTRLFNIFSIYLKALGFHRVLLPRLLSKLSDWISSSLFNPWLEPAIKTIAVIFMASWCRRNIWFIPAKQGRWWLFACFCVVSPSSTCPRCETSSQPLHRLKKLPPQAISLQKTRGQKYYSCVFPKGCKT